MPRDGTSSGFLCMSFCRRLGFMLFTLPVLAGGAAAANLSEINQKTVTLLAGESAWFGIARDISKSLAHDGGLQVLPMQADGCIAATGHLMQLTQVDVALLTTDCVDYAAQQGLVEQPQRKLAYVSRVAPLPLLLVTRKTVTSITALAGKRIATGPANSAEFASGELLLGGLGVPFQRVARSGPGAVDALKTGQADAALLLGLAAIDGSLDAKLFHVLQLDATTPVSSHAPALVTAAELRGLAGDTPVIETVSTSLVLAVFNWSPQSSKGQKVKSFSQAYFSQDFPDGAAAQVSATVSGWQRHRASALVLENLTDTQSKAFQEGDGP
jgi:ABC-type amino acid transport substrate-binding protein